ncbi:MAG TPA: PEP/pyruvate-binding domain-containing protein [Solirubrobacteraceae bacterium]
MTEPWTRPLDQLRARDEPSFGGKSAGLGELLHGGIPVPPGFAVSTAAFDETLRAAGLEHAAQAALAEVDARDIEAIERASKTIGDAIRSARLPGALAHELTARYRELGARSGDDAPAVAVRSSAVGEDSRDATFAGQQATYLWVRGVDELTVALHDCWASLYSTPAITYRARLAGARRPAIGVAVQLMVDAAVSGVMFTCNPVSGDPSMVAINASWGLGSAVVEGEVTPDDYMLSKVTGEVVREVVNRKSVQCVPRADGHGTELVAVPEQRRDERCLDEQQLAELLALAGRVQRHFGSHQDIEWAIAHAGEWPGGVSVVQSRPVTALAKPSPPPAGQSAMSLVMSTFGVRPARSEEES